jgi:hypothetical protein
LSGVKPSNVFPQTRHSGITACSLSFMMGGYSYYAAFET